MKKETKWQSNLQRHLDKANIRWSQCTLPEDHLASPGYMSLTEREKMMLGYTFKRNPEATSIDCSQSAGRCPIGHSNCLPTLTTSSNIYLIGNMRCLTGKESLMLHGFPKEVLDDSRPSLAQLSTALSGAL